ncbi:MAG TPA: sugar ABC transporter substrate-binding protein [bacterium]|nr:sugar ABC transporter substrate-binding protein [bacterium]
MKKIAFFAAVLVFAAGILSSGCIHKEKGTTLHCLGWGGVEEAQILQKAIDDFKKAHPGVEVQMDRVPYGDYITKVLTQFAAGMAPDVMCVNAEQMVSFGSREIFVDLKSYIDKDPSIKLSDFYPEAIDHYTYKGVLTALPRDIAPVAVVYYNKKKFDEAGVPYPKDNWDYKQFLATAEKLTRKSADGKFSQYGFVDDYPNWWAWVLAFGGKWVNDDRNPTRCVLDSPEAIAGVQFRSDLIHKYHVCPAPTFMAAMGGMDYSDLFVNGTAAMFHTGIWLVPKFRQIKNFDWDVVEFPKGPKGLRAFPLSAAGYGIVKTCKNPDLAYELVKYLAGEVGEKYMAATGLTQPAIKAVAASPVFLDGQQPKSKGFLVDAVKFGRYWPMDPNVPEYKAMVDSSLDKVWNDNEPAAKALMKVTKEINTKFFKGK